MLKSLQIPLRGLLAVAFLLAAAPASQAYHVVDQDLYDSLLKKCYRNSDDNDGDDIYRIIKKALEGHEDQGIGLVEKLIDKLKDNRKKLDNDVSKKDLDRVFKRLKKYLRSHRTGEHTSGTITSPESGTTPP